MSPIAKIQFGLFALAVAIAFIVGCVAIYQSGEPARRRAHRRRRA